MSYLRRKQDFCAHTSERASEPRVSGCKERSVLTGNNKVSLAVCVRVCVFIDFQSAARAIFIGTAETRCVELGGAYTDRNRRT